MTHPIDIDNDIRCAIGYGERLDERIARIVDEFQAECDRAGEWFRRHGWRRVDVPRTAYEMPIAVGVPGEAPVVEPLPIDSIPLHPQKIGQAGYVEVHATQVDEAFDIDRLAVGPAGVRVSYWPARILPLWDRRGLSVFLSRFVDGWTLSQCARVPIHRLRREAWLHRGGQMHVMWWGRAAVVKHDRIYSCTDGAGFRSGVWAA